MTTCTPTQAPFGQLLVRPAEDGDREAIAVLLAEAFQHAVAGFPPAESISLTHRWVACDRSSVLATMTAQPMAQWYGGAPVASTAVRSVAVSPVVRGRGVGRTMVGFVLDRQRTVGERLSILYASVPAAYRATGYGYAGDNFVLAVRLTDLPRSPVLATERADMSNLTEVMACYDDAAPARSGAIRRDARWWRDIVLSAADGALHLYATREGRRLTGYVAYVKVPVRGGRLRYSFHVMVKDMAWTTPEAGRSLLGLMATHAGLGVELHWPGRPGDLWSRQIGAAVPRVIYSYPWMQRLLDVPGALTDRRYPPDVETSIEVRVIDRTLPLNDGCWRLNISAGCARIARICSASATLDVSDLAGLYSGYQTATQLAVDGGLVGARPADVAALDAVFRGGPPRLVESF